MKHCISVLGGLCALACAMAWSGETYLVKDGKPQGEIILPNRFGRATLLAAEELRDYIEKMTGARLRYSYRNSKHRTARGIVLEPMLDGLNDSFAIVEDGRFVRIRGESEEAVLYGAYQYLQNLGVRWFMPGEIGENVPKVDSIPIGRSERPYTPAFRTRGLSHSGEDGWHLDKDRLDEAHREYDLWELRNKCHFSHAIHGSYRHAYDFNWSREHSKHNVLAALRDADFEKEPERFPLVNKGGKKERVKGHTQICFTDPRNVKGAVKAAKAHFRDNPHSYAFSLSLSDTGGLCECDRCLKANGGVNPSVDPNRAVWGFMNEAARAFQKELPGKDVCFICPYGLMTCPPAGVKAEPNIVCQACRVQDNNRRLDDPKAVRTQYYLDCIKRIRDAGAKLGCYDYGPYGNTLQPLAALYSPKAYHDLGFVFYQIEDMQNEEHRRILRWVLAQLVWDVNQDPMALLKTFCMEYYGPTGEDVLKVVMLIEESVQSLNHVIIGSDGTNQMIMTDAVIEKGRALLEAALRKASGRQKDRLQHFVDTFERHARLAQCTRAFAHFMTHRTEDSRQKTLKLYDECGLGGWPRRRVENAPLKVVPRRAKHLENAGQDALVKEMFAFDKVPAKIENLFLLPEVWKFRIDPLREGEKQGWMRPELDDSSWHDLSTYAMFEPQGCPYDGEFWYRVRFDAPDFPKGKRIILRLGALDDEGTIYLNGKPVFRRYHCAPNDWQSSFEIDVTAAVKPGEPNQITIHGDDAYGAGGLWKPCGLYIR